MSECIARLEVYKYAFMSPATLKKPAWSATTSGSSRDLTCTRQALARVIQHIWPGLLEAICRLHEQFAVSADGHPLTPSQSRLRDAPYQCSRTVRT